MTLIEMINSLPDLSLEKVRAITTAPLLVDPVFTGDYRMQTEGVNKNIESKLLTVANRDYPLRRVTGCKLPAAEARAVTQRTFIPREVGYEEKFCNDDFNSTVMALLTKANLSKNDLTGTVLGGLLVTMVQQENRKHLEPMAWFADEASANPQFNQINGYWKLIDEAAGLGQAARINTYAGTALTAGQGIQILMDIIDNASDELDALEAMDKVIYIGRKIKNQLRDDIRNGLSGSGLFATEVENGRTIMRFDGIEVRVKNEWDNLGNSVLGLGVNSNLAVLTKKQNMVWAINDTQDMSFEAFYDKYDMEYVMRNLFVFGAQIDYPTLLSVAY